MQKHSKIILGIDPGTLVTGYSVIRIESGKIQLLSMSVIKLNAKLENTLRLKTIFEKVSLLINEFQPDTFAIEAPFFGKNVQSMLKLGRAQGVAIAAALHANIPVTEYSPKKIKQSITGNGNAEKEQVWKMLQQILSIEPTTIHYLDASDALAVAVCHHFQDNPVLKTSTGKKGGDWKTFISGNPLRIKS